MPPKKKASTGNKKKGKQKSGSSGAKLNPAEASLDAILTEPNLSTECADAFAALFAADYPPKITYDDYTNGMTTKQQILAEDAYNRCANKFNCGNTLLDQTVVLTDRSPTNNRWYLAQQAFLDALAAAMKSPGAFLKTIQDDDIDHRYLLCKVCLCLAWCRGSLLDAKGMTSWANAAVSVDPTHYNATLKYAFGLLHEHRYDEALTNFKKVWTLRRTEYCPLNTRAEIDDMIDKLEDIKSLNPKSKERITAIRYIAESRRSSAIANMNECNMELPKKSCAMCFWPATENMMRCSTCLTVYYCHRNCQIAHWSDHKNNCIATKQKDVNGSIQSFPEPNYPRREWVNDHDWGVFKSEAKMLGSDVIQVAANSCSVEVLKRALMEEQNVMEKINKIWRHEYAIHRAALRNEPAAALEICSILIKHGACPNVYRGDHDHLLDICRGRAKWIDDDEPSPMNCMFRLPYLMTPGRLEEVEREESAKLVEFITEAIKNHSRCKHCKSLKATRMKMNSNGSC